MNKKRLRVLWNSNAVWSISGYGQAMADLLPLLRDEGYPLAIINFFGQAGGKLQLAPPFHDIVNYPVLNHTFGSDAMVLHGRDFKADVTLTMQDIWALNPQDLMQVNRFIPWVPIDHDPIPPAVLQNLRFAYRVIAMSKFGQEEMQKHGINSTYIPHTVDTKIFTPLNRPQEKQTVGIDPNTFIFGMVSANKEIPPRKSFQEVLDAFKLFLQKVPNSLLYIHTNPKFPGGFPVDDYAKAIGINQRVAFPDSYEMTFNTTKEGMNHVYNKFDCLLAPSVSEGFCVPIIEAQATGIPVITSDFTAMKELVEDGINGYKVKPIQYRWSMMQSQTAVPDTQDLFEKMMQVYTSNKRAEMGKNARKFIEENYALEKVFKEKWAPFFQMLENEVYGAIPVEAEKVLPRKTKEKSKIIKPNIPHVDKPIEKHLE